MAGCLLAVLIFYLCLKQRKAKRPSTSNVVNSSPMHSPTSLAHPQYSTTPYALPPTATNTTRTGSKNPSATNLFLGNGGGLSRTEPSSSSHSRGYYPDFSNSPPQQQLFHTIERYPPNPNNVGVAPTALGFLAHDPDSLTYDPSKPLVPLPPRITSPVISPPTPAPPYAA